MGTHRCGKICERPAVTIHVPEDCRIVLFVSDDKSRVDITPTAIFYIADGAFGSTDDNDDGVIIGDVIIPGGCRVWVDGKRISLDLAVKLLAAGVVNNLVVMAERVIKQREGVVTDPQGRI